MPFDTEGAVVPDRFKGADTFIAYFQNFTNTYGDLKELSAKWHKALSYEGIKGLALGTRPDCLGDDVLEELARISDEHFVQLELGFQTSNEASAEYIRRGFTNDVYFDAVARIHKRAPKVHVVTHVIFGLYRLAFAIQNGQGLKDIAIFNVGADNDISSFKHLNSARKTICNKRIVHIIGIEYDCARAMA